MPLGRRISIFFILLDFCCCCCCLLFALLYVDESWCSFIDAIMRQMSVYYFIKLRCFRSKRYKKFMKMVAVGVVDKQIIFRLFWSKILCAKINGFWWDVLIISIREGKLWKSMIVVFDPVWRILRDIRHLPPYFNGIWEIKPHKHHTMFIVPLILSYLIP